MGESGVTLFFDRALLPGGWAKDLRITINATGDIVSVEPGMTPEGAVFMAAIAVPGLPNLHSHAFQRGMAGLAERGGSNADRFWTWRSVMYRFANALTPDEMEIIAALAYSEMLESGFTSVAEFHYLHHRPDGGRYDAPAELGARIAAAAAATGIGLTLLPVLYTHGDFRSAAPQPDQRRFISGLGDFETLIEASASAIANVPDARLGIAPHSLRAVSPDAIRMLARMHHDGPIHIHAAEQTVEVEGCIAATGARPIEVLLDHVGLDPRWCVIHATHMTGDETIRLARSGAVVGLCPATEASLGDGIFAAPSYVAAGGVFGIGTDSNICIDAAQELRTMEYGQRLRDRARNVMAIRDGSTGRALFDAAARGGAQACGRRVGALAPGFRGDIVVLDEKHAALAGRCGDAVLDGWIFAARTCPVRDVFVGGAHVVAEGRHRSHDAIVARWRPVARRLAEVL